MTTCCESGGRAEDPPKALNRWYTTGIAADRAAAVHDAFDQAAARGITITILAIDRELASLRIAVTG